MLLNQSFYLDLTEPELAEIQRKFGEISRGGTLIIGKHTEKFEKESAEYIGKTHRGERQEAARDRVRCKNL